MTIPFSYCVLRYRHDPSTGEAVNVGVLLFAPTLGWVRFKGTTRTHALSALFRGFDRDRFLRFLDALESATKRLQDLLDNSRGQLSLFDQAKDSSGNSNPNALNFLTAAPPRFATAEAVAAWLLPDNGLSYSFGEARGGVTEDVVAIHDFLFERLITRQRPLQKERKRRDNDEVWATFQKPLKELGITNRLEPHSVQVPQFDEPIEFRHAYKNEKWHAIEAMSFDYADASSIREKALLWYGYGAALKQDKGFARLYLLLGAPSEPSQRKDYAGAKSWLSRMEVKPELIEEDEAADFARELADTMAKEGVLEESKPLAEDHLIA